MRKKKIKRSHRKSPMATSDMYAKFLTKKNARTAAVPGMIPGMVASASGVPAQARYPEKTIIIKSTNSIPPFREDAAVFWLLYLLMLDVH